jgi:uncharacterized protein YfdQ (DUF2303 family)
MEDNNNLKIMEQIGNAKLADQINNQLQRSDIHAVILPRELQVTRTDAFLQRPLHFTGRFDTSITEEFAQYTNDQESADVFIDNDQMRAVAFFDFGTDDYPENRYHTASIQLQKTADFNSLLTECSSSRVITQRDFVAWLEEYQSNIKTYAKEIKTGLQPAPINLSKAVNAIRNTIVKVEAEAVSKTEDHSESTSAFASIELKNYGNTPAYLDFTCTPYHGLFLPVQATNQNDDENTLRTFRVRISVITNSEKPKFSLKILNHERHEEEMTKAFKTQIKDQLDEVVTVRIGTFSH